MPASGAVTYEGNAFAVHLDGRTWAFRFAAPPSVETVAGHGGAASDAHVTAPMPGKIVKIAVSEGDAVEERALLVVFEAMKMEHRIEAPHIGFGEDAPRERGANRRRRHPARRTRIIAAAS